MTEKGQTTIEYVLVALIVILGIIFAFRSAAVDEAIGTAAGNIQNSLVVGE